MSKGRRPRAPRAGNDEPPIPLAPNVPRAILAERPVAVRSSATSEDGAEASFAGQHDTFLYQRGLGAVVASVKACWASAFTDRAVEYRHRHGVPHAGTVMAVVVQDMVESTVAGTAFSVELNTGFPAAQVAASYGLGEAVVSGEVTSDEWLFDRTTMACIKRVLGSKKCEYVPRSGASGCDKVAVEERRRARFCMDLDTARRVAAATLKVRAVYEKLFGYDDVDTEFAVAGADTVLHLQSQPVVALGTKEILTVDRRAARSRVVAKGSYSLLGAVTGTCRVIRNFEDLISGNLRISRSTKSRGAKN